MHTDLHIFKNKLIEYIVTSKIDAPTPSQLEKMAAYYAYLVQENKQYNLTRITQPQAAAADHFCDSLLPLNLINEQARIVDIGSGAGFPIAPIAAMRPGCSATAIEASLKKCSFITNACVRSGINIDVINGRAEELAHTAIRESFDVCVSRAVAPMNILMELSSAFIKPGGLFLAFKSDTAEVKSAGAAANSLNLQPYCCIYSLLPQNNRKVFAYIKTHKLPAQFPRPYAKIKKSPL